MYNGRDASIYPAIIHIDTSHKYNCEYFSQKRKERKMNLRDTLRLRERKNTLAKKSPQFSVLRPQFKILPK